jgi:HlyD family secretion protein
MATNHNGRWMALAAVIAVAGFIAWALWPKPVLVETAAVTRSTFERTVDEDGKTRVRERYVVSAPLAGRLQRVNLKAGAAVTRGTLLATLMPAAPALLDARVERELTERVGVAEAEQLRTDASAERARVALELARSELARSRDLAERGFTSKQALERAEHENELKAKELDAAQFDRHAAEHQLALARAALTRARSGRNAAGERWEIRSPVEGQVLRVVQESEAVVAVGAPILELGDPRDLEVVVDVLTADAAQIRPGAPAHLDVGDGSPTIDGRVRLVEPSAFTKVSALGVEEQRVNVVIDVVAPRDTWSHFGDGYRVDTRIIVDQRSDAILVPTGALFRQAGGWMVYVVDGGRARTRAVEIGARNASHADVPRGLAPGERVIVYPGDAVREGVRVGARDALPAATAPDSSKPNAPR